MTFFVFSTFIVYEFNKNKFINNSVEYTIVLDCLDKQNVEKIQNKVQSMTYQEVVVEKGRDKIYVKIKCPPNKFDFFKNWFAEKKWDDQ